ncbi:MAG: glycosyl transferase [Ferruginibacter sp.]|nr:glycosyl transferase [Cytophagales bacterium]
MFVVQGEGRGHLTQAITLSEMLREAGHEVSAVLVGRSDRREVPSFFYDRIHSPVVCFESPNFVFDAKRKSVNITATLTYNFRRYRIFLASLQHVHRLVEEHRPDVIVNFYDLLGGLYYLLYKPNVPFVCLGHQYLLQHPDFRFPKRSWLSQLVLSTNTRVTAFGADKKLALSFRAMADVTHLRLVVAPPLLRREVLNAAADPFSPAAETETQPYLLAYLNHNGFSEEVIAWHAKHPEVRIHCFWDKKEAAPEVKFHENLIFHRINDQKFLELMHGCAGYVCNAGFESVCEAMHLGKPVMMIPVHGHFEQACNALDALKAHAGIAADRFDFSRFIEYIPRYENQRETFGQWLTQAPEVFLRELESVCLPPLSATGHDTAQKVYKWVFRYTGSLLKRLAMGLS